MVIGNTTYLFPWFGYISYNEDGNCIIAEDEGLEETLLSEDPKIKGRKNIKILLSKNFFKELDLKYARNDKMLMIYNDLSDLGKMFK